MKLQGAYITIKNNAGKPTPKDGGEGGGGVGEGERMGERKSAFVFEDIAVPGNWASHLSTRSLLRMTATKTLFS